MAQTSRFELPTVRQYVAGDRRFPVDDRIDWVRSRSVHDNTKVAFIFAGHGSQWTGMALELLESSTVFREHMNACARAMAPFIDWSLFDVLAGKPGAPPLERVDVVQPALFAVMVSLAALWRSCGVEPAAVVGHSVGEVAAAHVAGGLSLDDAARVVASRSRVLAELTGQGAMAAVPMSAQRLRTFLEPYAPRLDIAVVTGPASVVVSGDTDAVEALSEELYLQGIHPRRVAIDYASHSHQVEAIAHRIIQAVSWLSPRGGDIPFYSPMVGGLLDTRELGPEYWYRIEREAVQFDGITRALLDQGHNVLIEISPHPLLTLGVQHILEDTASDAVVVESLRRDDGGPDRFYASLAQACHPSAREVSEGRVDSTSSASAAPSPPLSEVARRSSLHELVRTEAAALLKHPRPNSIAGDRPFLDLGFDSLMAVEFRDRLNTVTGLNLPITLIFDHPTPTALVQHLLDMTSSESGRGEVANIPRFLDREGRALDEAEASARLESIDRMSVADLVHMALSGPDTELTGRAPDEQQMGR